MSNNESSSNSALSRAFKITEFIASETRPVTAVDIALFLNLPKASVHRILSQLEEEDIIARDLQGRFLSIGSRFKKMSLDVLSHFDGRAPRQMVLKELTDEIQETCNLSVLDGYELLYFERVEANWPMMVNLKLGSRLPLHCTASGKLFLALMPRNKRKQILSTLTLEPQTKHSITNVEDLNRELDEIGIRGISIDNEELIEGMVAIAVPVCDQDGNMIAGMAIHAPTLRLSVSDLLTKAGRLKLAAKKLESLMTFQPQIVDEAVE